MSLGSKLLRRGVIRGLHAVGILGDEDAMYYRAIYVAKREGELRQLSKLLQILRVDLGRAAIDVGANVGVWTLALQDSFKQVFAIEANSRLCRILRERTRSTVINAAASNTEGKLSLWIPSVEGVQQVGWTSTDRANHPKADNLEGMEVACLRLENLLAASNSSFLKIDVEGHEIAVLEGLGATVCVVKPTIICEVKENNISAANRWARDMGFCMIPTSDLMKIDSSPEMYIFKARI